MSSEIAIQVSGVSKHYLMFERPEDRLKQMVLPRLFRFTGREPRRYYRDFAALNNVSFEVGRGETVGIIGRNGSGKSTLLQIICGTLQPTSGTVEVKGRIAALLELGAGFNPEFTGRENVFMNAAILGLSSAETEARFDDIARFADIGIFIDQPVKTYSSGMYVRLAFATAINVEPDILVVDEALAVGDEAFQRKCFARVADLKDKGATILFVSHGAQTVVQLCDRAILMDSGEKLLDGRPKTVVNQYQRLVNLAGKPAASVRNEIKAVDGWQEIDPSTADQFSDRNQHSHDATPSNNAAQNRPIYDDEDCWLDPSLSNASSVIYENQGATISNTKMKTASGRTVNVIKSRQSYTIEFDVTFSESATNVAFGFTISTATGLHIGGAGTSLDKDYQLESVEPGQVVKVRFAFDCPLNPGTYFVTSGVSGITDRDRKFLHRIIDTLPFKVINYDRYIATGFLHLLPVPQIQIVGRHICSGQEASQ